MEMYTLITGASSGIGEVFSYRYASEKKNLILIARTEEKLMRMKEELESKFHVKVQIIAQDMSIQYSASKIFDRIQKEGWKVETLINDAGFAELGPFEQCDFERQHQMMQLNMVTLTELTYLFVNQMLERNEGTIVNISSAAAFCPFPYASAYSASKSYVLYFTESIQYEYRNSNLRILAVCPGATATNFFQAIDAPVKMKKSPEDVVDAVFYALKNRRQTVCSINTLTKLQAMIPHFASRKFATKVFGSVGYRTWGNKK